MTTISVSAARARLSEIVNRVEAGEDILITRRGKTVARLTAVARPKKPVAVEDLARFRATMPSLGQPAGEFFREKRDEGP